MSIIEKAVRKLEKELSNKTEKAEVRADTEKNLENETGISLGDLSPDLKKVENYYM